MFVDISGFPVIKIVLASIDALVEKEVIPEVSEELSCTEGACGLTSALSLFPAALSVIRDGGAHRARRKPVWHLLSLLLLR